MIKSILAVFVVFLGMVGGYLFYAVESHYLKPKGSGTIQAVFEVRSGESFRSITKRLEEEGLIESAQVLNLMGRFYNLGVKVKKGEYGIHDGLSPQEIIKIFIEGKSITYPFTVTEGLNSYEIALLFERRGYGKKEEFLSACTDRSLLESELGEPLEHCEGYLFPETYNFEKKTSASQMVTTMLRSFVRVYEQVAQGRVINGWGRHQVLTFASLIEKETGAPWERPLIASVFFNRLNKGMRLQTDPTVLYGVLKTTGSYPQNLTRRHLQTPTPYNTYTKGGLPPGPIANPGREALKAVFEPESSEYLFFVSKNDGTHVFTKTYDEHKEAVRQFQLDPKARQGKSWRDLKPTSQ